MGLFLDLIQLSAYATDDAIEHIYKAHHHGDDGIWKPHSSPLIRKLIELFTQRGLDRLEAVRREILAWQDGSNHVPHAAPVELPPGTLARWTDAELALVKIYLEAPPPANWTIDDNMLSIDYVCQRYLPADVLVSEAEWLATRAGMMGKVQANMQAQVAAKQAEAIIAAMPSTVAGAAATFKLSPAQHAALDFARVRCVENVRALSDAVRHRMRAVVAQDLEQRAFGNLPPGTSSLQTKLVDEFAALNRDWRRIAVTEAGEAQLQGYVASLKPGTKVKRVERYDNACSFCRKIDGAVATVVAPNHPNKDPDTMIWPGKNNVGRSASPKKRVGDVLVARDPEEMWTLPAGLAHPHCRGRWVPVAEAEPDEDPEFAAILQGILGP